MIIDEEQMGRFIIRFLDKESEGKIQYDKFEKIFMECLPNELDGLYMIANYDEEEK